MENSQVDFFIFNNTLKDCLNTREMCIRDSYSSAAIAAREMKSDRIVIVDSLTTAAGLHFLVERARAVSYTHLDVYKRQPYDDAKYLVAQQVKNPVLWQTTIENMIADGFDTFIEVGEIGRAHV